MQPKQKSLAHRSLQGIKWNYLGTIVRVLSQLVAQVALARILGPETIGAFGYAVLLAGVLGLLIDQGLGWAMVHADSVSDHEAQVAFTRIMISAVGCSAFTVIFASEIARIMGGDDQAATAIRYFSPAFLLLGLSVITQAELRKALKFKEIQISQTTSYLIAYPIVGVLCAVAGMGIFSLVAAWLLQALLSCVLMIRYAPRTLRLANPASRLSFGIFGRDILAINLVNWFVDNAGGVFIGRLFGTASLGLYNTTMALVRTPANHLVVNIQTVLFPTAAAAKADTALVGRLYSTALSVVLFFAIPTFTFVAVSSPAIVNILLGAKWSDAGAVLPPIALAMIPHVVSSVTGSTLSGRGDQRLELASQTFILVMLVLCYLVLPLGSVVQVCWLFLALYVSRATFLVVVASRRLQVGSARAMQAIRGPTTIAAFSVAACLAIGAVTALNPLASVALAGGVFATATAVALAFAPQFFLSDHMRQLIGRFSERQGVTGAIAKWLARN